MVSYSNITANVQEIEFVENNDLDMYHDID